MGRPVVLSNGQLFVGLDENGLVHDFYYPYVGLENLTTSRRSQHKIGVWVDGQFKWVDDGSWEIQLDFEKDALISDIKLHNRELAISLHLQDYIDNENNSLIRHITVTNESGSERDVRIFMHQVFQLSDSGRADTALYVPEEHYILDYKGRYSLLIAGKFADGEDFDQYAVGNYGIEGKAGTFIDAVDGELSSNAVEHAGVDSVIRFKKRLRGGQSTVIDYWVVAASSQSDAQSIHLAYKHQPMEERLRHVRQHWQQWIGESEVAIPDFHRRSLLHSLLIVKAHCDERGSVLASGDSSIFNYGRDYYCYCWPRDAAYALWPLIRLGHFEEVKQFIQFARDTMHRDGYLMHKYQPDKAIGSTWHPLVHNKRSELGIQEDETASVIFMLGEYCRYSKDYDFALSMYDTLIRPAANFMSEFMDAETNLPHASYDLWEEKFLTTTYSAAITYRSLVVAAWFAHHFGHADDHLKWQTAAKTILDNAHTFYDETKGYYVKGYLLDVKKDLKFDTTLDVSSFYGVTTFGLLKHQDIQKIMSTAKAIEKELLDVSPSGGTGRYTDDNYFKSNPPYRGNPWIVTTMWMAQFYVHVKKHDRAKHYIDWAISKALPSGILSEQINPETSAPTSVAPLVWSHAELINTILDYSKIK